jgi:hypothetical protein
VTYKDGSTEVYSDNEIKICETGFLARKEGQETFIPNTSIKKTQCEK